jgi:hypothetical protein
MRPEWGTYPEACLYCREMWARGSSLIRRARCPGLVTLRQTFVGRRHLGWTASEPPRRDAHHKTEFPDVAVSLVVRLGCDRGGEMELTSTVRAAPSSSSTPGAHPGRLRNRAVGIRDGPLATATPDASAAADPRAKSVKRSSAAQSRYPHRLRRPRPTP